MKIHCIVAEIALLSLRIRIFHSFNRFLPEGAMILPEYTSGVSVLKITKESFSRWDCAGNNRNNVCLLVFV